MKYVYPVIFEEAEEGGYCVTVPDIQGCFTQGEDLADAVDMVEDAIEMMLVHKEDENQTIPTPSEISKINVEKYRIEKNTKIFLSVVVADTKKWRMEKDSKVVKKNLTLPQWLARKAEKANVNFSQTLQEALCTKLGIAM